MGERLVEPAFIDEKPREVGRSFSAAPSNPSGVWLNSAVRANTPGPSDARDPWLIIDPA